MEKEVLKNQNSTRVQNFLQLKTRYFFKIQVNAVIRYHVTQFYCYSFSALEPKRNFKSLLKGKKN